MSVNFYTLFTVLIVLTAAFSYINHRFIKLPATIGIMLISLLTSLGIVVMGKFYPSMLNQSTDIIRSIDFENVLMKMMLSFLLFAGPCTLIYIN
jgi:CPA1 family monovalent cation:H+ antiporter